MLGLSNTLKETAKGLLPKILVSLALVWSFAFLLPPPSQLSAAIGAQVSRLPAIQSGWNSTVQHLSWNQKEPDSRYDSSKRAMLIEPRRVSSITPTLLHMMAVAPPEWPFTFLGSSISVKSVMTSRAIQEFIGTGKLTVAQIPDELGYHGKESLNKALTNMWFYDNVVPEVEWLFMFGIDSILCANAQTTLNDWLGYDWVGSLGPKTGQFGGSGGFSLRKVSRVKQILQTQERKEPQAEDEFFTTHLAALPDANMIAKKNSTRFAVERVWADKPMGYHLGVSPISKDVWGVGVQRLEMYNHCPEIKIILSPMKMVREKCADEPDEQPHAPEEESNSQDEGDSTAVDEVVGDGAVMDDGNMDDYRRV